LFSTISNGKIADWDRISHTWVKIHHVHDDIGC
jgi:hypothetical protein